MQKNQYKKILSAPNYNSMSQSSIHQWKCQKKLSSADNATPIRLQFSLLFVRLLCHVPMLFVLHRRPSPTPMAVATAAPQNRLQSKHEIIFLQHSLTLVSLIIIHSSRWRRFFIFSSASHFIFSSSADVKFEFPLDSRLVKLQKQWVENKYFKCKRQ